MLVNYGKLCYDSKKVQRPLETLRGDNERNSMSENQNPTLLFAEERKEEILKLLHQRKKIVVPELCDYFGVSASTIRSDLRELEKEKQLIRTHGGAIISSKTGREYLPENKNNRMAVQKRAIANVALERIEDGDRIAIMTGTTAFELLQLLPQKKDLLVILNDIQFANWLEQNTDFDILMLGGFLRKKYHYVTSPFPNEFLNMINIDKTFITCNGVTLENGITTPDFDTALITQKVLKASNENIVLCDSSKMGRIAFAQTMRLDEVDELITDEGIEQEDLETFRSVTTVTVAPNSTGDGYYRMPD